MSVESYDYQNQYGDTRTLHDECKKHMYYHVAFTMRDGSSFDGIIENVGMDGISVLVGEDVMEQNENDNRQYYGGYGRPRRRFRRFRRQFFPFAALAALSLFPYIYPYLSLLLGLQA